ncbi:MAG: NAD(P)H-hydrate dehydratase [Chloroflexota bacterium]
MRTQPQRSQSAGDWRGVEVVSPKVLRGWQLPQSVNVSEGGRRGRALVVAGSSQMPGAASLASTAALRAGAAAVHIATVQSIATAVGLAVPESRVSAVPETEASGIDPLAAGDLAELANSCQATLIGPGLMDPQALQQCLAGLLPRLTETALILDGEAILAVAHCPDELYDLRGPSVLTLNAPSLAILMEEPVEAVLKDLAGTARRASARFLSVIVVKGAESVIADTEGRAWRTRGGPAGFASSGPTGVLSGIITGIAARGADLAQAAVWGTFLHSTAAEKLSAKTGPMGFLTHELLAEIPPLMAELSRPPGPDRYGADAPRGRRRRA